MIYDQDMDILEDFCLSALDADRHIRDRSLYLLVNYLTLEYPIDKISEVFGVSESTIRSWITYLRGAFQD